MPHTSSTENRGRRPLPREMVYDEEHDRFVPAVRLRKRVGSNSHYRKDRRGWKYGSKRHLSRVPRQWARHKPGVGPITVRRVGDSFETKNVDWHWFMRQSLYQFDEEPFEEAE